MCIPNANLATNIAKTAFNLTNEIIDYKENKKLNEIKTNIALKNIQNEQDKAKAQIQTGIEKAREKRIANLSNISYEIAKNSKSGFDLDSQTFLNSIEDNKLLNEISADNIMEEYKTKAQNYINSANNMKANFYMNNSKNNSLLTALGKTTQVASSWFKTGSEDEYVHF